MEPQQHNTDTTLKELRSIEGVRYASAEVSREAAQLNYNASLTALRAREIQLQADIWKDIWGSLSQETRRELIRIRDVCTVYWDRFNTLLIGPEIRQEAQKLVGQEPSEELKEQHEKVNQIVLELELFTANSKSKSGEPKWNLVAQGRWIAAKGRLMVAEKKASQAKEELHTMEQSLIDENAQNLTYKYLATERQRIKELVDDLISKEVYVKNYTAFLGFRLPC